MKNLITQNLRFWIDQKIEGRDIFYLDKKQNFRSDIAAAERIRTKNNWSYGKML